MPAHLPVRCCSYRFQDMDRQVDESRSALIGGRWGTSKRMWPTSSRHKSISLHVCLSPAIGFLFGTGAGPALLPRRRPRRFATPKPFSVIRRRRCWQSPRVVG